MRGVLDQRLPNGYVLYGVGLSNMQESLVSQGFSLLLYGMGTVFVFLTVLVLVVGCISYIIVRFFPEPADPLPTTPNNNSRSGSSPVDAKTLRIIKAAIDQHRAKRKR